MTFLCHATNIPAFNNQDLLWLITKCLAQCQVWQCRLEDGQQKHQPIIPKGFLEDLCGSNLTFCEQISGQ